LKWYGFDENDGTSILKKWRCWFESSEKSGIFSGGCSEKARVFFTITGGVISSNAGHSGGFNSRAVKFPLAWVR
jgi:hypothetical protein